MKPNSARLIEHGRKNISGGLRFHCGLALLLILWVGGVRNAWSSGDGDSSQPAGGYTFYVAPHSHIDIVWYWTYDKTQVISIRILRQALDMLRRDPRYTFTQDQMAAVEPFWETLSDADKAFLRRMVKERRFELATGMYVQPDIAEPDFESLTRQFFPAKQWMETTFATKVVTAWNIDTYGQTVQMPQLFRKAGVKYFVFMRDVLPSLQASVKSPFYWQGADGSKILSYWLSGSYDPFYKGISEDIRRLVDHNAPGNDKILFLYGGDLYPPKESTAQIEKNIREAAAKINVPIKSIVFCTPSQYFEAIEKSGVKLPTYTYDFNPPLLIQDLRGLYGERPDAKLANRRAEDMLESAEKFSTIATRYGQKYPGEDLRRAWGKVVFNQDHDAIPGSHIDPVDDTMMSQYGGAIESGRAALAASIYRISRNINTSGSGDFPFLVFNPLSFRRTDVVHYTPLFKEQVRNFRLLDETGRSVPFRLVFAGRRHLNEPLSMAAIEFVATDVPPLGYCLYRIESIPGTIKPSSSHQSRDEISNRFFTIHLDRKRGGIVSIVNRQTGEELLDTNQYEGNELVLEDEKDPDMEGMLHLTGTEIRMSQYRPDSIIELKDAVGTRVKIEGSFLTGRRTQEITLYNDVPRIDFKTKLLGFPGHDGLLTVVFPLRSGEATRLEYETHNAVVERPDGIYYAQTFVDAESGRGGVAIVNQGMGGYHTEKGIIRMILLRSVTNYRGYYTPKASEAGSHVFEYSIYAHTGDWRNGVVEQAHSFNSPLRVISTDAHAGSLPARHSFLSVEAGHFEVTALKKSERGDNFILRGHETQGYAGTVRVRVDLPVSRAWIADLLEHPLQPVAVQQGVIEFKCRPFEFVTLRLALGY